MSHRNFCCYYFFNKITSQKTPPLNHTLPHKPRQSFKAFKNRTGTKLFSQALIESQLGRSCVLLEHDNSHYLFNLGHHQYNSASHRWALWEGPVLLLPLDVPHTINTTEGNLPCPSEVGMLISPNKNVLFWLGRF